MRTIRVTGKGNLKVKPDMTRITITLNGMDKEYSEALKGSVMDTEEIKDIVERLGFERTDLKTLNFNIDTEYESYKECGEYKQRFKGYGYFHRMKIEFTSDNEILGKILYELANSHLKPEFRISYTVSDPEKAKNELLCLAVKDAKEKARVLTEAGSVTLKDIVSIDYSWGEVDFDIAPMDRVLVCNSESQRPEFDIDIEPEDIKASDTVTIIWEIE